MEDSLRGGSVKALIDEFERRIKKCADEAASFHGTRMSEWYPWIVDHGPTIVSTVRLLMADLKAVKADLILSRTEVAALKARHETDTLAMETLATRTGEAIMKAIAEVDALTATLEALNPGSGTYAAGQDGGP